MGEVAVTASRTQTPEELEKAIQSLLAKRQFAEASEVCSRLRSIYPERPGGYILGAQVAQQVGDIQTMIALAAEASTIAPKRMDVAFLAVDASIFGGDIEGALEQLEALSRRPKLEARHKELVASKFIELGQFESALGIAECLATKTDTRISGLSLSAAALTSLGRMQEAERIYDELLQTTPQMTDSWYLRSALRRAKPEKNTVEGAEHRLKDLKVGLPATIPVHYALAREFEDLGSLDRAFEHLRQGAAARRKILSYNVQSDVQTMSSIAKIFSADWAETALQGACKETPVFILGLPRSGTTLVDRILSSHSQVSSLGEVNDLAYGVIRLSGPAASKSNLLEQAANLDLNKLGHDYMKALRGYGATEPYLIDKTPANFLYLGLIMQALPNAKIVHLSRHPMASGYAMFKTLFRMGYPFSYDQQDLGRYISAYLRLMDHWYDLYPDRIHRVQYETLVTQQEVETRRLLDACGLEWESASLNFQDNSAPTATASASQVREPIHTRSVEQWKALRSGLLPLEETLRREGIAL